MMTEMPLRAVSDQNDQAAPPQPVASHVHFGPADHQVIPVHWASLFLTILFKERPDVFGEVLVKVVGAELPTRRRNRTGDGQ